MNNRPFWAVILGIGMLLPGLLGLIGCGGGGGGGGSSDGTLEVGLVPVKIQREGTSDREGIFAFAKGSGVAGGSLENTQQQPIVNSDLTMEYASNRYEVLLEGNPGSFLSGQYTLKYFVNGETKVYQSKTIEWTTIPTFNSAKLSWDSVNREVTISSQDLSGGPKYQLELYDASSGFLRRVTSEFPSSTSISEYVPDSGNFIIGLVANFYEAGLLKARAVYYFKDTISQ